MVPVCVRLESYMSHGGCGEEVRVVVAALGCDVGGYECCEDGDHLLLVIADHPLELLSVDPRCWMVAVHVGVVDGSCV